MTKQDNFSPARGFTLLEMAVSLLVLGLLAAPVLTYYNGWIVKERKEISFDNVVNVVEKLNNYRALNGFYPLPARLDEGRMEANYGRAISTPCWTAQNPMPIDEGPFDDPTTPNPYSGIAKQVTVRGDLTGSGAYTCLGFLPFRDIQIEEKDAYDAYGGRIFYAVTVSSTDINTIDDAAGAISVRDGEGNSLTPLDGNMTFVVFSAGANKVGAFNKNGNLVRDCSGNGLESINCNMKNNTLSDNVLSEFVATFDREDFDDVVQYFSDDRIPLWHRNLDDNAEDIRDISPRGVLVGKSVGDGDVAMDVAVSALGSQDSLYVRGSYSVDWDDGTDSNSQGLMGTIVLPESGLICDRDADPENLGDDCISLADFQVNGSFDCPTGEIAVGIKEGAINCIPKDDFLIMCPTDRPIFLGMAPDVNDIDGDGDTAEIVANCVETPKDPCAPISYDGEYTCGAEIDVPEGNDQEIYPGLGEFVATSDCSRINFVCINGAWEPNRTSGYCVNFPDEPPPPYDDQDDPGYRCGLSCNDHDGGDGHYDDDATYCVGVRYECLDHPPGDADADYWHLFTYGDNSGDTTFDEDCSCSSYEETVTTECGRYYHSPYLAGDVIRTKIWDGTGDPGDCNWSWGNTDDNNCVCNDPGLPLQETAECPDGQTGEGTQRTRTWDPSIDVCNYSDWVDGPTDCGCDMNQSPEVTTSPFSCDGGNTCNEQVQPLVLISVPTGSEGDGMCIWSNPVVVNSPDGADNNYNEDYGNYPVAACVPRTFNWKKVGSSNQSVDDVSPGAIIIGDSCSCDDNQNTQGDSTRNCFSGDSDIIDYCKCLP